MLDTDTKRRIDTARDILVGKVPDPKSQVEQITIALIYKFMDDMDAEAEELGGKRKFFTGNYARYGWAKLMAPSLGGHEMLGLYGDLPIRTVSVLVYKPLIAEPEKFQNTKFLLYRYATRLLLERVSWLGRDQRRPGEGDGFTEVIFSNRSNMSYEDIRSYLRLLLKQAEANPGQVQIDKTVIDPERIRAVEHSKLAGLQVADAVASGFHFALKVNRYGETETGYLPHLKKTIYRHKAVALGYGLKLWPEDLATVKAKAPEAFNLEGL